jgi:hypothetical protein
VIALAPLAVQKTSTTNSEAEVINLFMLVLLPEMFARWLPETTQPYGNRTKRDAYADMLERPTVEPVSRIDAG